jgi:glycosyltransferase involved in cell wall biosynthesis
MSTNPPQIVPPAGTGPRPFWSVMIPSYNRTTYLERTLRSVLSQDPGAAEMQIEVLDNASPVDDPEPLVRRVGGERVVFFRQARNLGGTANWNSCIERSRGEWVHILHSDDLVLPGFYQRLRTALEKRDDVGAAFCRYSLIDENDRWKSSCDLESPTQGVLPDFIDRIGTDCIIATPSIVVRRSVYEQLGAFRTDLTFTMDWEMWIRIAARYPIWYEPTTLAAFRVHANSWTSDLIRSAETIVDGRRCIALVRPLLPPDRADTISKKARELVSLRSLSIAGAALGKAEFKTAFRQTWEALKCCASPRVMMELLWFAPARLARGGIRRAFAARKRPGAGGRS